MTDNNNCPCGFVNTQEFKEWLESRTTTGNSKTRPIQRRRGTATEHAEFIGLDGEITVDTTNKTLRVHDGVTQGGSILAKISDVAETSQTDLPDIDWDALDAFMDQLPTMDYVIEKSALGANPWYRKYKSGWVEQGGTLAVLTSNISLPVIMKDTTYSYFPAIQTNDINNFFELRCTKTTTALTICQVRFGTNAANGTSAGWGGGTAWIVRGTAA